MSVPSPGWTWTLAVVQSLSSQRLDLEQLCTASRVTAPVPLHHFIPLLPLRAAITSQHRLLLVLDITGHT
jgi:hypothetical protein